MKMKPKILLGATVMFVGAVVTTTIGGVGVVNNQASKSLQKEETKDLLVQSDMQKERIETYFNGINSEVRQSASLDGDFLTNALIDFQGVFSKFHKQVPLNGQSYKDSIEVYYNEHFGSRFIDRNAYVQPIDAKEVMAKMDSNAVALQYYYISENPHPLGKKDELVNLPGIKPDYSVVHAKYHPHIREYLKDQGFYDLFLVDAKTGNIIYSVYKELDFATSLLDGPYANSDLAQAFRQGLGASQPGEVFTTDISPYYPSYNDYASFVSTPLFVNGELKGVYIIQMPLHYINQIMTFDKK